MDLSGKVFEFLEPKAPELRNKIFVPVRYSKMEVVSDIMIHDGDIYIVDDRGDVHYFKFKGTNLAGVKE